MESKESQKSQEKYQSLANINLCQGCITYGWMGLRSENEQPAPLPRLGVPLFKDITIFRSANQSAELDPQDDEDHRQLRLLFTQAHPRDLPWSLEALCALR